MVVQRQRAVHRRIETGDWLSTTELATGNNLKTTLRLLQDNGGKGNVVRSEGNNGKTQPTYCVKLKLTCQPDFMDLTVNAGNTVTPYLETILTAKVPSSYSLKKAFVIHVLADGITVEQGFPLFNILPHPARPIPRSSRAPTSCWRMESSDHRPHEQQREDELSDSTWCVPGANARDVSS